jgi:hypothetical protein
MSQADTRSLRLVYDEKGPVGGRYIRKESQGLRKATKMSEYLRKEMAST